MDQPACLWDVATGKEIRRFGGEQHATWVVFSPNGKMLAYSCDKRTKRWHRRDNVIRLADVTTGKDLQEFGGHKGFVTRAAFSPNGTLLASADDRGVHLFEIPGGQDRVVLKRDRSGPLMTSLAFSPDGSCLAAASWSDKSIWLIQVATGNVIQTMKLTGEQKEVDPILYTPNGKTLISGHDDGYVLFWDMASGRTLRQFRAHESRFSAITLSRNGRTLATSSLSAFVNADNRVCLWETATAKPLVRFPGPQQEILQLAFSPDSQRVATCSGEGTVDLWEAASGKLLQHCNLPTRCLAFLPDGQTVLCGGLKDGRIHFLNATKGKETWAFPAHKEQVYAIGLSRDGKMLATAGADGKLRLWDVLTGRLLQDLANDRNGFFLHLAFSPDGKLLVSSHHDTGVCLWETKTGKLLREAAPGDYLAFTPDGGAIITTTAFTIQVSEVATGKVSRQLGHGEYQMIDAMALSPNGHTLTWGDSYSTYVYFWEMAKGQTVRKLSGHQGHVTCLAFSPNGRLLAAGGSDGCALIWDVTSWSQRQGEP
jgi:WD40 repeat protein